MVWYAWLMIAFFAVAGIANVLAIGQPRKPLTPGTVALVLIIHGLMVWGIVELAT